jgi:hypothetical protein
MSKSLLAIGGIGIAGCVLLSVMMQQIASQTQTKTQRPDWLVMLESEHGEQLVGSLAMHEEDDRGATRIVVSGTAKAGCDRAALARAIANSANRLLRDANAITGVQVTLCDPDGQRSQSELVPHARPPR